MKIVLEIEMELDPQVVDINNLNLVQTQIEQDLDQYGTIESISLEEQVD